MAYTLKTKTPILVINDGIQNEFRAAVLVINGKLIMPKIAIKNSTMTRNVFFNDSN